MEYYDSPEGRWRPLPICQCLLFQSSQEEIGKWGGTPGTHGYTSDLVIEVLVESKMVVPDDHLEEVPQHVFETVVGGCRWCCWDHLCRTISIPAPWGMDGYWDCTYRIIQGVKSKKWIVTLSIFKECHCLTSLWRRQLQLAMLC